MIHINVQSFFSRKMAESYLTFVSFPKHPIVILTLLVMCEIDSHVAQGQLIRLTHDLQVPVTQGLHPMNRNLFIGVTSSNRYFSHKTKLELIQTLVCHIVSPVCIPIIFCHGLQVCTLHNNPVVNDSPCKSAVGSTNDGSRLYLYRYSIRFEM